MMRYKCESENPIRCKNKNKQNIQRRDKMMFAIPLLLNDPNHLGVFRK